MPELRIKISGKAGNRDKEAERLIKRAASAAFGHFGFAFKGQVDVLMTDDEEIRQINREYRDIDSPTDVLSFPMVDFAEGEYEGDISCETDPESGLVMLGDMIISCQRAREQAEEYGHGFERECAYLTVHSMLHLLGFDHLDEGVQKKQMRKREEEILSLLGISRNDAE